MKFAFAGLLGLLWVGTAESRELAALDLHGGSKGGTVTRVVKLLQNLEEKLEQEAEAEKDLYDKFVCWGTSTTETKTNSITKANKRIAHLTAYIADIESGKLDFTDEKQRLDADLIDVNYEIANLTARRAEDLAKHLRDMQELQEAEEGLDQARDILRNATDGSSQGTSLLTLRGSIGQNRAFRSKNRAAGRFERMRKLRQVLKVADQYLKKDDANVVRRIIAGLHGEPQDTDTTEELRSKSGGIITLVGDLKAQTHKDVEQEQKDEFNRVKAFNKTLALLTERKEGVIDALDKMAEETAAREKAKTESQDEIDALNLQNTDAQDLIDKIAAAMQTKETEYGERSTYRQGELQALGTAIQLLTSDDARDLFRKAISFLQTSETESESAVLALHASNALLSAAKTASDSRLMILATNLAAAHRANPVFDASNDANITNPTFDDVLAEIDAMKQTIQKEEDEDFKKKETCEKELDDNKAKKLLKERGIEAEESKYAYKVDQIQDHERQIEKILQDIADVEGELKDAKELRAKENAEYLAAMKDDQDAVALIEQATKVVTDFYEAQKNTALLQTPVSDELKKAGAKETWDEASYGGAGAQSAGVVETMKVVADDVKKEMAVADKEEAESLEDYEKMKEKLEETKASLEESKLKLEEAKGAAEEEKGAAQKQKEALTEELHGVLDTMADVKPGCDFYLNNFAARQKNRLTEMKGLDKAKAILKGAVFEDKSRELKAGDA